MAAHPDKKKKKKNVMKEFSISELSMVDRPAQADATMTIMKRKDDDIEKVLMKPKASESRKDFVSRFMGSGAAKREFPDQKQRSAVAFSQFTRKNLTVANAEEIAKRVIMTSETDGHVHILQDFDDFRDKDALSGTTSWNDDHNHPWILDAKGNIVIGMADDHNHEPDIKGMEKLLEGSSATLTKAAEDTAEDLGGGRELNKEDNMSDPTKEATAKQLADLEKKLTDATAYGELSDIEKSYHKSLDDTEAASFLTKSASGRADEIKKSADADPVVYTTTAGLELRKSVGDVVITMAKQNDDLAAKLAKSEETAKGTEMKKFVDDHMANLPGEGAGKTALAKAIDAIDNGDDRTAAMDALEAMNKQADLVFKSMGTAAGSQVAGSPEAELDTLAKTYAKDKSVGYHKAYAEVMKTKTGQALYADMRKN